jgi:hypothetical protein
MPIDLATALPDLLPKALAWAEKQCTAGLDSGARISGRIAELAETVGVQHPQNIRIIVVTHLPVPDDPELKAAAFQSGLLDPSMVGLTLGYAVFLRRGHEASHRLLSHEFRHVHQYEAAGSIAAFLPQYLQQIVTFGYYDAPYEVDARSHERGRL